MKVPTLLVAACMVLTGTQDDDVRSAERLWSELVEQDRAMAPLEKGGVRNPDNIVRSQPSHAQVPPTRSATRAMVGITIWKFRPTAPSDPPGPRIREIVHGESTPGRVYLTPVRVQVDSQFRSEDKIVLGISSTRRGYLYVWSREKYSNGTIGPARLVFPVSTVLNGDNRIRAGQTVRLPAATDDPPVFTLRRKPNQVVEEVIVLVTPSALSGVAEGSEISAAEISNWVKQWGSTVTEVNVREQTPMTHLEMAAMSGDSSQRVRPQRFLGFQANNDSNLLVAFPLAIRDENSKDDRSSKQNAPGSIQSQP